MIPHRPTHRHRRVELLAGELLPHHALDADSGEPVCLLESPGEPGAAGRWSFLCSGPFLVFRSRRSRCWAGPPGEERELPGAPLDELAALLDRFRLPASPPPPGAPPLLGGAAGYLAYELLYELEEIPDLGADDRPVPDLQLGLYDVVLARDGLERRSWLVANGFGASEEEARAAADRRFEEALERLRRLPEPPPSEGEALRRGRAEILARRPRLSEADLPALGVRPVLSDARYAEVVEAVLEHLRAGDLFELCTTRRFDVEAEGSGLDLYRVLREVNPAPFSAYLRFPGLEVLSSSPERFLRLDREGTVETRPVKGTRPRGRTPEEDAALRQDLASCAKDRAENLIIVDLARNDLGRVCAFGTVEVPELAVVEEHPFTFQLVSTIRGRLRPGLGPIDLIRAAFPGGSMTGAPKVEAMTVIDRLEPVKRGVFSGSVGYLDFDGSADLSIVIRTLVKTGDRLGFHTGGAIVADSSVEEEVQETLDKAHGLVTALELWRGRGAGR